MNVTVPPSLLAVLEHPDALSVRKRPLPVPVFFATTDGVCETLEGPVRYRIGDALLTGSGGERWPMRRPDFDAAYRLLPDNPEFCVKIVASAVARRLDQDLCVPVGWQADLLTGHPGDWVIAYADRTFGIVCDDIFRATYEADDDETRWPPP